MKKTLKIFGKTMKVLFIVFCVYLVSLCFWRQRLPEWAVESLCRRFSQGTTVLSVKAVSFGFRDGLLVSGVRLFDTSRKDPLAPVLSFEAARIRPFQKRIEIQRLSFPRLGDSYYEPTPEVPSGDALAEAAPDLEFELPEFEDVTVVLDRASVLGVEPRRLTTHVSCDGSRIDFANIRLVWPDEESEMALDGTCTVDFGVKRVDGFVRGTATQAYIRPLLVALDLPVSLPYMDGFTGVVGPVKSYCGWGVDLTTRNFKVDLELEPRMGRYNGVPLRTATGALSFGVTFVGGRMDLAHAIGPIHATDRSGGRLDGTIYVTRTNGVFALRFDASSSLAKNDTLDIIDYLNEGGLDELKCTTAPTVTAEGMLYPDNQELNDLSGQVSFAEGAIFGIPLKEASARYAYVGDTVRITDARACGKRGGRISGRTTLVLPCDRPDDQTFDIDLAYDGGCLEELADFFRFDLGDRKGAVDAKFHFAAPLGSNVVSRLNGEGSICVRDGHLAQMKLFLALTEMLSEYVPGVSSIVNQSQAHGTFSVTNGVMTTHDAVIDGSALLSIYLDGTYDIVRDQLDFGVKVRLMKDDSLLGKYLIRPVLWPFAKLLMEFRLTGSLENPTWKSEKPLRLR